MLRFAQHDTRGEPAINRDRHPTDSNPALAFDRVGVTFKGPGGEVEALRDVSLAVQAGEFVAIIGPSGCGKSTLLKLAADVLAPTSGTVAVRGAPPAQARRAREFSVVFQNPVLLPWRNVQANVELALEIAGRPAPERRRIAGEMIELVGLAGFERARPAQLSGGMQQRVAIARALTLEPSLLLMDEPFGAVDELTRDRLNDELLRLWQRTGAAILFVTHSIEEAVYLSDRVAVLTRRPGRVASVLDVDLERPRSLAIKRTERAFRCEAAARLALEEASGASHPPAPSPTRGEGEQDHDGGASFPLTPQPPLPRWGEGEQTHDAPPSFPSLRRGRGARGEGASFPSPRSGRGARGEGAPGAP